MRFRNLTNSHYCLFWPSRSTFAMTQKHFCKENAFSSASPESHHYKRKSSCTATIFGKLHCCNVRLSAVRTSFLPIAALLRTKNSIETLKKLCCKRVALSCWFPADLRLPRLGSHFWVLLAPYRLPTIVRSRCTQLPQPKVHCGFQDQWQPLMPYFLRREWPCKMWFPEPLFVRIKILNPTPRPSAACFN